MKKFKSEALRKLAMSFCLFLGLMMFGQISFGQSLAELESDKATYVTLQQTFAPQSAKWVYVGEVITALDIAIAAPDDYTQNIDMTVFDKVKHTTLDEYSTADLNAFVTQRAQLVSEGKTATKLYYKVNLILGANNL